VEHFSPAEAMLRVTSADSSDKPFFSEISATIRAEAGLENAAFAVTSDPKIAVAAIQEGEGAELSMPLGGEFDPSIASPFDMIGTVMKTSPEGRFIFEGSMMRGVEAVMGPSSVIRIGGVETVVITNLLQAYDRMFFVHFDIMLEEKSVVAVKSAHHFRAAYGPMAREIISVNAAGITSRTRGNFPIKRFAGPYRRWIVAFGPDRR
tara:strand:- start:173 stop:790 length:618 start_codon:yes stop_codon:yes gene_type:complete